MTILQTTKSLAKVAKKKVGRQIGEMMGLFFLHDWSKKVEEVEEDESRCG